MKKELKLLSFLHVLNDGFRTAATTILPFVSKDLSLTLTQVGLLGASQTFIGTTLAIPSTYFAAKIGGFKLLLISLILYSLGFFGIAVSQTFLILIFTFYTSAIGFAFFHPISFALVTRLSEKKSRGKNMGNFMSLGDIGRMIIPTLALIFIPFIGWRLVMMAAALIGVIIYVISQFFITHDVDIEKNSKLDLGKRAWFKSSLSLLLDGHFRRILLAAMGDTLASGNIYIFLPFLLLARGISPGQLVIFTSAFFLGSLSGKSFLGRAVDTYGNRKIFVLSEFAMMGILLMLIISYSFIFLVLISYLLGIFTKGTSPVVQTLVSETIHEVHYEKAYGASETFIQISGAITVFLSGMLADHFGITAVYYTSAVLAVLATLPIILPK